MLSVAIHMDIAEYKPKVYFGLTGRTLACCAAALGIWTCTGLYITFVLGLDVSDFQVVGMILSMPFWAMGFWKPNGMKAEVFAKYWIEYNFTRKNIQYKPAYRLAYDAEQEDKRKEPGVYDKEQRKLSKLPGIEAYSAKAGRVII